MTRKHLVLIVISLALMGAYIYTQSQNIPLSTEAPAPTESPAETFSAIEADSETNAAPGSDYAAQSGTLKSGEPKVIEAPTGNPSTASPEIQALAQKPILELVPNLNTYKNEVANAQRSGPPPSLLRFSQAMEEKYKNATQDQAGSRDYLPELSECVKRANVTAAQQVCFIQAKKIQKQYPDLTTEVEALEKGTPKDVIKRAKLMGY